MSSTGSTTLALAEESIVTGEAVTLEVHPASVLLRMAAAAVDVAVSALTVLALALLLARADLTLSQSTLRTTVIALFVGVALVVPVTIEVATNGRSLGKWAFGLQVVRDDGGSITLRHSLVRGVAGLVECWATLGALALVLAFITPRAKRMGDLMAGTTVVSDPQVLPHDVLVMPPDLREWASRAEILPPSPALAGASLAHLRTAARMNPAPRAEASARLARALCEKVWPAPPSTAHPERVIAAVLVTVRDRQWRREVERMRRSDTELESAHRPVFGIGADA